MPANTSATDFWIELNAVTAKKRAVAPATVRNQKRSCLGVGRFLGVLTATSAKPSLPAAPQTGESDTLSREGRAAEGFIVETVTSRNAGLVRPLDRESELSQCTVDLS